MAMQQRVAATYESLQRDYAAKLAERDGQGLGVLRGQVEFFDEGQARPVDPPIPPFRPRERVATPCSRTRRPYLPLECIANTKAS